MKNIGVLILIALLITGCKPKKGIVTKQKKQRTERVVTRDVPAKPIPSTTREQPNTGKTAETASKRAPISSTEMYIDTFKEVAMRQMQTHNIPASITLAQGILESGAGRGRLAVEANNHFGIKCHGWTGEKIYHDDDAAQECFRKYQDPMGSYEDHSKFLTGRPRYADLFQLKPDDYKGWARGLRRAGYATDRQYPEKLIGLIERYHLYEYDNLVLNGQQITPGSTNNSPNYSTRRTHTVVAGDTLYSLSRIYNTTIERLQQLNGLTGTNLSVGQVLKIN
jgi:flagellum-specific peptidoglycan hydrolase FlgJ